MYLSLLFYFDFATAIAINKWNTLYIIIIIN